MVMKLNSPIPQTLPKECSKAAKIFQSFVDSGNNGLDGVIPRAVLESAKGFAIFTIFKAGFLFSARAGSGIVIAKLEDGSWSSPSAIGTAGVGIGSQLGAEMTDFLVVLNTRSAITSFMAAGSLTLGGNMSLALGPLGRTGEAIGSVNSHGKVAAMYSYSKTRGLFGGLSIEGSVIVERQDANVQAYKSPVTARILLGGMMDPPEWAAPLIKTLEACTGLPGNRQWIQEQRRDTTYAFGGLSNPGGGPSYLRKKKKSDKPAFPPASWGKNKNGGSYFASEPVEEPTHSRSMSWDQGSSAPSTFETRFESDFPNEPQSMSQAVRASTQPNLLDSPNSFDYSKSLRPSPHFRSMSLATGLGYPSSNEPLQSSSYPYQSSSNPFTKPSAAEFDDSIFSVPPTENYNTPAVKPEPRLTTRLPLHEGVARAIALFDFKAVESGDLSFSKGDIITITQKSESSDDWWTGKLETREGIFPANFVEVL